MAKNISTSSLLFNIPANRLKIQLKFEKSYVIVSVWSLCSESFFDYSFATAFECNSNTLNNSWKQKVWIISLFLLLTLWCIDSNGFRFRGLHTLPLTVDRENVYWHTIRINEWHIGWMNRTRMRSSTLVLSRAGLIETTSLQISLRMTNPMCEKRSHTNLCLSCGWFICLHCLHYWAHTRIGV